jgi:hypothetical protein
MVNTRNNPYNGQASNNQTNNTTNPQIEQLIATQNQLIHAILQTLNHLQSNPPVHQQQPPPPPPQCRLGKFVRTRPTTFSQAKDPMEAEDWLKSIEKKLEIAHCTDQEKVHFAAHQLFGTTAEWWDTYDNSNQDVGAITWDEFNAQFRTHYVPRGTLKQKKKEFFELQHDGMTVNEYLNKFTQMSRYAPDEVNTDEKKHDAFLNRLNDEILFQLLNTDYEDFQKMVDKTIIVKNKIKEMEKNGKRKTSFLSQSLGSNTRPLLPQSGPFFRNLSMVRPSMHGHRPPFHMQ